MFDRVRQVSISSSWPESLLFSLLFNKIEVLEQVVVEMDDELEGETEIEYGALADLHSLLLLELIAMGIVSSSSLLLIALFASFNESMFADGRVRFESSLDDLILRNVQSQFKSASWSLRYFMFDSTKASSSLSLSCESSLSHALEKKSQKNESIKNKNNIYII